MGFSRKLPLTMISGPAGSPGVSGPAPVETPDERKRHSNQRFRSFAERYVVERAKTFRADHEIEDAHNCTLAARTIYKMIAEVGRTLTDDT